MPYVRHSKKDFDNRLFKIIHQRVHIESAFALCYFQEGGIAQSILHSIKYKGNQSLARRIGKEMATEVLRTNSSLPDVLVPIPLHPKKMKIRGFNQSEELCKGMRDILSIPIEQNLLQRNLHKESQTHLGRISRWENISAAYSKGSKITAVNHIGIIDDMITTGSTIEACCQNLRDQNPKVKISVFSFSFEA